jgi:endoglycosylceramidase
MTGGGVTRSRVAAAATAVAMCSVLFSLPTSVASAQPTTTTTTLVGSSTTTTTAAGGSTTTTTAPGRQHVLNQPNLNALSPHIEMLSGSGVTYQYSSGAGSPSVGPGVPTFMSSPGGPYIYDSHGRVVILHGVNVVYKHPPYIAYPDAGEAWNFDSSDASRIQSLGFNMVRLGIEWQALEPGTGGPNQPNVCTPGTPGDPHEFNKAIALSYLRHVATTVNLLARHGIYTLLDMHQDVFNTNFRGEGAPDWAVCTNNVPIVPLGGRWSNNYGNPTLETAVGHFWNNDVVGNLQGQFDLVWQTVASYFKNNPWIVGYDPYNEPFETATTLADGSTYTSNLQCFYTGRAHESFLANGTTLLTCPSDVPDQGVIPSIQAVDRRHLIFLEPDIYWVTGGNIPSQLGPLPFRRIVFNFHDYCGDRSPVTGDPIDLLKCLQAEETMAAEQDVTRLSMSSAYQPSGPAIFMSEFGATTSVPMVGFDTEWAGISEVGWAYWAWKYYADPTGSSAESLVLPDGTYSPIVQVLSRTYPQEVAGNPQPFLFNPFTGAFSMIYTPSVAAQGTSTVIDIAASQHYASGWCAAVQGGKITSKPGDTHLAVQTVGHPLQVAVSVTPGGCPSS